MAEARPHDVEIWRRAVGRPNLCLPTISASFPAAGKRKKKKEKLNKEKVFSSDSGEDELVDMDEHELFV